MQTGRFVVQALVIMLLTSFVGCGNDDAVTVAGKFWGAVGDQDLEKAKSYSTRSTGSSLTIDEDAEGKTLNVEFGNVTVEDGNTVIATVMQTKSGNFEMSTELQTVLVREEGKWKVDVNQTMMSMFGGAVDEMMQEMGEAMQGAMQGAMEGLGEAMEESMQELGKTLESSMVETPEED